MKKARVLFLGTHNTGRSQIAEALLRHHGSDRFEVYSAGLDPAATHNPLTITVLQEIGIPIDGQQPKYVGDYLGKLHFGYLITVCATAEGNCPVFPGLGQRLSWADLEDPEKFRGTTEAQLVKFRQVRDEIDGRIRTWLAAIS
jgi:arsenate reductase